MHNQTYNFKRTVGTFKHVLGPHSLISFYKTRNRAQQEFPCVWLKDTCQISLTCLHKGVQRDDRSRLSEGLVKQVVVERSPDATWEQRARPCHSYSVPWISQDNQWYLMQSNQKQNGAPLACIFINLNQQIHSPPPSICRAWVIEWLRFSPPTV